MREVTITSVVFDQIEAAVEWWNNAPDHIKADDGITKAINLNLIDALGTDIIHSDDKIDDILLVNVQYCFDVIVNSTEPYTVRVYRQCSTYCE